MSEEREAYAESVLRVVEAIPPGRVLAYGDVARAVGRSGPRRVGRVLAEQGGGVPWWRVVRADGGLPDVHRERGREHYCAEATPLRPGGLRVDMAAARWEPPEGLQRDLPSRWTPEPPGTVSGG